MPTRQLRCILAALVVSGAAVACGDDDDDEEFDQFRATLIGANERPNPVTTNASGSFTMTDRGSSFEYELIVNNMTNVTASHIHTGSPAVAGPVIVDLFTGPTVALQNGVLRTGTFTQANVKGLSGAPPISLDSLRGLIRNGNAYVNVHSTQFPGGEIRGPIVRQ